jgi:hypothetical protein
MIGAFRKVRVQVGNEAATADIVQEVTVMRFASVSVTVLVALCLAGPVRGSEEPVDAQKLYTVKLQDGQTLTGRIVDRNDSLVVVQLTDGTEIRLRAAAVSSIDAEKQAYVDSYGKLRYPDPNKTRYLFAPSAFMLKKGEMKLSQHQVMWTNFGAGITDYISVQVGAAFPLWFIEGGEGMNFLVAAKGGGKVAPLLHLAGGIEMFVLPVEAFSIGLPFATATLGADDYHVSLSGSAPFSVADGIAEMGDLYWYALCGFVRLGTHVGLLSENWIFHLPNAWGSDNEVVLSLAARLFGRKFSSDLGLMFYPEVLDIPLPWLSFTFHFG